MFVSDELVYIQLQKTGCTHIAKILSDLLNGDQFKKHYRADEKYIGGRRTVLASIRNPWDWYLSLWSFGCEGKGAMQRAVTKGRFNLLHRGWKIHPLTAMRSLLNPFSKRTAQWRRCYSDAGDPYAFRDWLYMVNDQDYIRDLAETYCVYPMNKFAGLYSFSYLSLCCKNDFKSIRLSTDLIEFEKQNCYIDYFIRNENLEEDLIESLALCGVPVTEETRNVICNAGRTNSSFRASGVDYFDSQTIELVRFREKLIVDKFQYNFKGLN